MTNDPKREERITRALIIAMETLIGLDEEPEDLYNELGLQPGDLEKLWLK